MTGVEGKKEQLFWSLAEPLLERPGVSRGTMMGLPCLRLNGRFFASIDRDTTNLVIKLPADRVGDLISSGTGAVFAPNHRVFREWVAVPIPDRDVWSGLLDEARVFASSDRAAG